MRYGRLGIYRASVRFGVRGSAIKSKTLSDELAEFGTKNGKADEKIPCNCFEFWGKRKGKDGAHRGSLILDGTLVGHVEEDFAANTRVDTCGRLVSDVAALESGPWARMCWTCCQRAVTFNHCRGRASVVALIWAKHVVPRCNLMVGPPILPSSTHHGNPRSNYVGEAFG
ncbi:hypothetical protein J1N35_027134 [Gossypium stocksii]|uniref:Uncharacterized protein n=1 Tax=Gossypium stocksii TaxID=47602 RepID=A0A9D3ZZA7_9ROSI|nr:hypothetical protein J1N35_027134 [Gossypium stocksii]